MNKIFVEYIRGLILGVLLGVVGTKAFQTSSEYYSQSEVRKIVKDTTTLACFRGQVETIRSFTDETKSTLDCLNVGKKWASIYE